VKRTPIRRKAPLRRLRPMRRRPKSAYRPRPRDTAYMAWVRRQPCAARGMGACTGHIEADHAGRRSVGRKAGDDTCIPLCHKHHVQRTSFSGPFRSWSQTAMRRWLELLVMTYRGQYQGELS